MGLLKHITFTLALLAASALHVQAQLSQHNGDIANFIFTPDSKVCLGQSVTVSEQTSGTPMGDLTYDFGDGSHSNPPDDSPTHTYGAANTFTVTQTFPVLQFTQAGITYNHLEYSANVRVVPTTVIRADYTLCGGGRVNLHIYDDRFDSYDINFGDGTGVVNAVHNASDTTESIHIYATAGIPYNISIKAKFAHGTCSNADLTSLPVTPIATVPKPDVVFLETTTEDPTNGVLSVLVINTTNFIYEWDFKRNGFSYTSNLGTIANNSGTSTLALNRTNTNPYNPTTQAALYASYTLNSKQNSYCVRLATTTACGREALSDEICSITKFTATAGDLQNNLAWEAYSGPNSNTLDVLELSPTSSALASGLPGSTAAYTHTPVTCTVEYEYQIRELLSTTSPSSGLPQYSLSAKKKVTATSLASRPALTNVNSTINGSNITVTFDAPTGGFTAKSYTLQESVNGGSYNSVAANTGTPTNFTLTGKNTATDQYCYQVNYVDLCNLSPANGSAVTTCPVKLNVGLAEDGTIAVNWTAYSGSTPVTTYTVEVRDENGTVLKTIPAGSSTSTTDLLNSNAGQLYYIVIGDNGSTSTLVELQLSPAVYVPDAFSPNGDGTNDFFELKGRFIKSINLSVFNRWGEPVFHSTDIKDQWDGKVNGGDATIGTYAYTLEVTGQKGEVIKHKGTITLVR